MAMEPRGANDVMDIVLSNDRLSAEAHKGLYSLDDSCYIVTAGDLLDAICSASQKSAARLHIAADWDNLLRVAFWTHQRPPLFDVMTLLRKAGAAEPELQPFAKAEINDLFPWLYYGGKFDILRRICLEARSKAEAKVNRKGLHIYCHLVAEESRSIIASSL